MPCAAEELTARAASASDVCAFSSASSFFTTSVDAFSADSLALSAVSRNPLTWSSASPMRARRASAISLSVGS